MRKVRDSNQAEIIADLRQAGVTVQDLADVGGGCADILCGYRGKNFLLELKIPGKNLRPNQVEWHDAWRGQVAVVRSSREAFEVIGVEIL